MLLLPGLTQLAQAIHKEHFAIAERQGSNGIECSPPRLRGGVLWQATGNFQLVYRP